MSPNPRTVNDAQLVHTIKVLIAKGDHAKDKAEQFYVAAGQHLKTLKERSPTAAAWEKIIREKCDLGKSRAYELLQIADGRTTVEKTRNSTNQRKLKHREQSNSLRSGTVEPEPEPPLAVNGANLDHAKVTMNVIHAALTLAKRENIGEGSGGEIERLRARNEELETENARLCRENMALRSEIEELKAAEASTSPERWSER